MMTASYLDVLPAHPQPEPLESLNSYLRRVAQANGIHRLNNFRYLTTLNGPHRLLHNTIPPSFGELARITACPEQRLMALTVHHVGQKFNRAKVIRMFLAESVVRHLRYCPACLAETGYYPLTWGFSRLSGCPQHGVHLLDSCGHCGQQVPLTTLPLSMIHCPMCGADWRTCPTTPLSAAEQQNNADLWQELAFLLTPQPWERIECSVTAGVQQLLAFHRLERGLTIRQVARHLGVESPTITAMENETQPCKGETLDIYLRYAEFLQVRLIDLFHQAEANGYKTKRQLREESLVKKTQQAIIRLKHQGLPVTWERVADLVGWNQYTFPKRPHIRALIRDAALEQRQEHVQQLCHEVELAIQHLKVTETPITLTAIAREVGKDRKYLMYFLPVEKLMRQAVDDYERQRQQREDHLLEQLQQAIVTLQQQGQPPTWDAISNATGLTEQDWNWSPRLKQFMRDIAKAARRQAYQQTLAKRAADLEAALLRFRAQGLPVTQQAVFETIGISEGMFQRSPDLKTIWRRLAH